MYAAHTTETSANSMTQRNYLPFPVFLLYNNNTSTYISTYIQMEKRLCEIFFFDFCLCLFHSSKITNLHETFHFMNVQFYLLSIALNYSKEKLHFIEFYILYDTKVR